MAVNIRLSTTDEAHRATQDVDVVAGDDTPSALEVLPRGHQPTRQHTVVVDGIEVDIIETHAVTAEDLDGLDDNAKLFIAGHRWALDTARHVNVATTSDPMATVTVRVATPAGLIATKSHAVGYPNAARRTTKHGGDLYDLFRLVEAFDARGQMRAELTDAPNGLGTLVADVVQTEILANPARAVLQMSSVASTTLDIARVVDAAEPFVAELG
jgi:hypothetical protein